MTPLDCALEYLHIFFVTKDFDALNGIFSENMQFSGPLHSFSSAKQYIDSIQYDVPDDLKYEIIDSFEKENTACVMYWFWKNGVDKTPMAQYFHVENGKIQKILLVFDSKNV